MSETKGVQSLQWITEDARREKQRREKNTDFTRRVRPLFLKLAEGCRGALDQFAEEFPTEFEQIGVVQDELSFEMLAPHPTGELKLSLWVDPHAGALYVQPPRETRRIQLRLEGEHEARLVGGSEILDLLLQLLLRPLFFPDLYPRFDVIELQRKFGVRH